MTLQALFFDLLWALGSIVVIGLIIMASCVVLFFCATFIKSLIDSFRNTNSNGGKKDGNSKSN